MRTTEAVRVLVPVPGVPRASGEGKALVHDTRVPRPQDTQVISAEPLDWLERTAFSTAEQANYAGSLPTSSICAVHVGVDVHAELMSGGYCKRVKCNRGATLGTK